MSKDSSSPKKVPLKEIIGLDKATGFVLARSWDNSAIVVCLQSKSVYLESTSNQRRPKELPANLHRIFAQVDSGKNWWGRNTIKDDVIYFSDDSKIVSTTLDGKKIVRYPSTEGLNGPRIMYVGSKQVKFSRPVPSKSKYS